MENKKLWLGILVMVLVFGMTVVGCGEKTGYLKVVNENDQAITEVGISVGGGKSWTNLNITKGNSRTFDHEGNISGNLNDPVWVKFGDTSSSVNAPLDRGNTVTVILSSNGHLRVE